MRHNPVHDALVLTSAGDSLLFDLLQALAGNRTSAARALLNRTAEAVSPQQLSQLSQWADCSAASQADLVAPEDHNLHNEHMIQTATTMCITDVLCRGRHRKHCPDIRSWLTATQSPWMLGMVM